MIQLNELRTMYGDDFNVSKIKIEKSRENFGVWLLPLFNHLGPKCTNGNDFQTFEVEED